GTMSTSGASISKTSLGKSRSPSAPRYMRERPSKWTEYTVLMSGEPPHLEPAANPAAVTSCTSYSPGPEMTKGCLSPRPACSEPFMSTWLREINAMSAPKLVGLKFFEDFDTGPKTSVVSPALARTHAPSWNVSIIAQLYRAPGFCLSTHTTK